MRVLVLGGSGMLGAAVVRTFCDEPGFQVFASLRSASARQSLPERCHALVGVDVTDQDALVAAFLQSRPRVVINCIGLIKQLHDAKNPLLAIPINALLPHRLAQLCDLVGARLIHISTDCVFSGAKGAYTEADAPDAEDLYGRSKLLGEVATPHALTVRTSIIGEELNRGTNGLIGWFLSQAGPIKGYRRAVFSGFPTVVLARIIRDVILPRADLHGLYHVSAAPIDKYSLLSLVKHAYDRDTEIIPDDKLVIDRSLDSHRFRAATGFEPPGWPDLVGEMRAASHQFY